MAEAAGRENPETRTPSPRFTNILKNVGLLQTTGDVS